MRVIFTDYVSEEVLMVWYTTDHQHLPRKDEYVRLPQEEKANWRVSNLEWQDQYDVKITLMRLI